MDPPDSKAGPDQSHLLAFLQPPSHSTTSGTRDSLLANGLVAFL